MPIADYRFDAYNNVIVPFQINDETHVIPSNAPYVVRLNEVPLKESPSSLVVKFENNTALTEVSASPAASQFWPDFNTADQNWNTGTLRFNASDAGKVVKVSYKGTGTLASVKSNRYPSCWLERGDGSLGDKVCVNGEVFEGTYNFKSFTVPTGVTIYIEKTAKICCTETFRNLGTINGQGRGGAGAGADGVGGWGYISGGSGGGGGRSSGITTYIAAGYMTLDAVMNAYQGSANAANIENVLSNFPIRVFGGGGSGGYSNNYSSGGSGGGGGAGLIVVSKYIIHSGSIIMSGGGGGAGGSGSGGGGGGGGGVAIMVADTLKNTGSFDVSGGGGGWGYAYGGSGNHGWYKLIELGVM